MSLNPQNSFSAKIFIFTTFLVMLSIAALGYDYIRDVQNLLRDEYMSRSLDTAEKYGFEVSSTIQSVETNLIGLSQYAASGDKAQVEDRLKGFKEKHPSLKGIYTFEELSGKIEQKDEFGDGKISIKKLVNILGKKKVLGKSFDLILHSFNTKNLVVARRFKVSDSENFWIAGVFSPKLIERLYSLDEGQTAYVLDMSFKDIYSSKEYRTFFSRTGYAQKIMRSVQSDSGAGFISDVVDRSKKNINVTFYQLPLYDVAVVFHRKTANLFDSIKKTLVKVGLKISLVFLIAIMISYLLTRSIVAKLEEVFEATVKIASGDFEHQIPIKSRDEIGLLAFSVNRMSHVIRDLLLSQKEKLLLEKELETAQMVQNTFFKDTYVDQGPFRISSYYVPASQCGGDWWGHFDLGEDVKLVVIGDATGHGVPAALITAMAYTTANTFAHEIIRSGVLKPPSLLLAEINKVLSETLDGKLCMTFYAMIFDARKNQVTFANGGHVFPFLIPDDPKDDRITSPRSRKMKMPIKIMSENKGSSILGIDGSTSFVDDVFEIRPGDRYILYTDGITESVNTKGKMMGNRGFIKILQSAESKDIKVITDHVIENTIKFNAEGDVFEDDVTLVVVEFAAEQKEIAAS